MADIFALHASFRRYTSAFEVTLPFRKHKFRLRLRQKIFVRIINAKLEEIALVLNTSTELNVVANILEYPSVVYP